MTSQGTGQRPENRCVASRPPRTVGDRVVRWLAGNRACATGQHTDRAVGSEGNTIHWRCPTKAALENVASLIAQRRAIAIEGREAAISGDDCPPDALRVEEREVAVARGTRTESGKHRAVVIHELERGRADDLWLALCGRRRRIQQALDGERGDNRQGNDAEQEKRALNEIACSHCG